MSAQLENLTNCPSVKSGKKEKKEKKSKKGASDTLKLPVRPASRDSIVEDDDGGVSESGESWGNEEEWRDVKVEMVECEVPIKVWPGNTAFKATEVVFDV